MDLRLRCLGCGRLILVPRAKIERSILQILPAGEGDLEKRD